MARQTGPNFFIGRRGNLLGYRMGGGYFVRVISSLTAGRVKRDPAFSLTMQYAGLFAKASKIASAIYRGLPKQEHGFYRKLTGMAMQLLKQGVTTEQAYQLLYDEVKPPAPPVEVPAKRFVSRISFPDDLLDLVFSTVSEERETEAAFFVQPAPG
mgnify:CR=1 FL=1